MKFFLHRAFALSLLLALAAGPVRAELPPPVKAAIAKFHAEGAPGWAYTQTSSDGSKTVVGTSISITIDGQMSHGEEVIGSQSLSDIVKGDVKAANAQYRETVSTLDKSVQKGVLHSNTVSRYTSRLNARLKALATAKA